MDRPDKTKQRHRLRSWELPESLWKYIEARLPEPVPKPKGGRPSAEPRRVMATIFYILRTGIQWKAVPSSSMRGKFVSGSCAHEYFQLWDSLGVFDAVWADALAEYDEKVGLDMKWQSLDGSMTKAPLGGEKNGPKPHRPREARHEALHSHRGPRHSDRCRHRWGECARLQAARSDSRADARVSP
jgi:transposase